MERTTKTITTPNQHDVVLYDYITGREQRQIQNVFLKSVEIKSATELSGFNASAASEAQDVALGIIVRELDGVRPANIVDAVLDLPAEDTQAIIDAINEITDPKKK